MFDKDSKILVVGAGAVGGISAALLAEAGYNVEVVCKYPDLAEKIKTKGIHITGVRGEIIVTLPAVAAIPDIKEKKDILLLSTKAIDLSRAAEELLPFLKDHSVVVSMQNGICEESLAKIVGRERTTGCIVGWGATMHSPGELEMTSSGTFVIGNLDNRIDTRLESLKTILAAIVPTGISRNIMGDLYSKLIINARITTLGAICGLYLGEMLAKKKVRRIFIKIMEEAMAAAEAQGIKVETYAGKLNYYRFLESRGLARRLKRHLFIRLMGFKYRRLKSSALQSLERGKRTEIDYLNGYIVKLAGQKNIPVPLNAKLVKMVKEIEAGKRKISPANFTELIDLL